MGLWTHSVWLTAFQLPHLRRMVDTFIPHHPLCGCGATDETRTHDLRIKNPLLYQLSYGGLLQPLPCLWDSVRLMYTRLFCAGKGRAVVILTEVLDLRSDHPSIYRLGTAGGAVWRTRTSARFPVSLISTQVHYHLCQDCVLYALPRLRYPSRRFYRVVRAYTL